MATDTALDVVMPQMGVSVSEGTITKWLKQEGDQVAADESLLEISTDKVDTEVPSPGEGVVLQILVPEGETVDVGTKLAVIGPAGTEVAPAEEPEPAAEEEAPAPKAEAEAPAAPAAPTPAPAPTDGAGDSKIFVSPVVARIAAEHGVDVGQVPGTGRGGRVTKKDILAFIESGAQPAAPPKEEPAAAPAAAPQAAAPTPAPAPPQAESGAHDREDSGYKRDPNDKMPKTYERLRELRANEPELTQAQAAATLDLGERTIQRYWKKTAPEGEGHETQPAAPPKEEPAAAPAAAPQAAAPARAPAPAQAEAGAGESLEPMSAMRKGIAAHMRRSLDTSAHVTSAIEVDMSRVVAIRAKLKGEYQSAYGVNPTYLAFVARATVETLRDYPWINGELRGDQIVSRNYVNLGFAVELTDGKGLIVPVIKHAEGLNLLGMARSIAEIARKAREKQLLPDDVQGGTFTITNPGGYGTFHGTPVISQPQAAILGTYAVVKRPWVVQDELGEDVIAIRPIMNITLTYDHRLVDGALAGRFLRDLREKLETSDETTY